MLSHDQVIRWTKATVFVYSDSVLCLRKMLDHSEANRRREGHVADFQLSASYAELLGIDGEPIEFDWNILPGRTSLQILQRIQSDLQGRNIEPEKFEDRIIFMSMFNDIDWTAKGNEEKCISNQTKSRCTRRGFRKDIGRFLVLETKRCGMEIAITSVASQVALRAKETRDPVFTGSSPSSCGILKRLKGEETTRFNADAWNTELLFQVIHQANQLSIYKKKSIYGAVQNWGEQFDLNQGEKESVSEKSTEKEDSVNKVILNSMNSQEVNSLVSTPRTKPVSGNISREICRTLNYNLKSIR